MPLARRIVSRVIFWLRSFWVFASEETFFDCSSLILRTADARVLICDLTSLKSSE